MNTTVKAVGRPRRMDLETLLDVAATMDLATISMKALADKLGIGVATVYRYVKDRESLIRLASARTAHHAIPVDTGQDWRSLLLSYADSIFSAFNSNPSLMHAYIDGYLGSELEVEIVDRFLQAMTKRGFDAQRSLQIFHSLAIVAMGAAVVTLRYQTPGASRSEIGSSITEALREWDDSELTNFRPVASAYIQMLAPTDLASAVAALIAGIEEP